MSSRTRCISSALLVVACIATHDTAHGSDPASSLGADFSAIGDQISADGLPTRVQHLPTGIVLLLIPAGEFTMGSPDSEVGRERSEVQREAEWEYACRAGTTTAFAFGERVTTDQVHYAGQRRSGCGRLGPRPDSPVPVRSLPPNPWGLYEMHGNQLEWCEDLWVFEPGPGVEVDDVDGAPRVIRGGSFTATACQTRSSYRDGYPPNSGGDKYGFRVARSIAAPDSR